MIDSGCQLRLEPILKKETLSTFLFAIRRHVAALAANLNGKMSQAAETSVDGTQMWQLLVTDDELISSPGRKENKIYLKRKLYLDF